jgi:integral membrane protein
MLRNPLGRFRLIAQVEGASYILLVFIAMPLKYGIGWDLPVRYVGMIHGVLFIMYCLALFLTRNVVPWSFPRGIVLFIASLVPFGTIWADRRLKEEESQLIGNTTSTTTVPTDS